jgi:hypothetical protein
MAIRGICKEMWSKIVSVLLTGTGLAVSKLDLSCVSNIRDKRWLCRQGMRTVDAYPRHGKIAEKSFLVLLSLTFRRAWAGLFWKKGRSWTALAKRCASILANRNQGPDDCKQNVPAILCIADKKTERSTRYVADERYIFNER